MSDASREASDGFDTRYPAESARGEMFHLSKWQKKQKKARVRAAFSPRCAFSHRMGLQVCGRTGHEASRGSAAVP